MPQSPTPSAAIILWATAVTPLHPGAGRSPGVVDLPVMRDSFGIPLLPASTLKGALKAQCARRCIEKAKNNGVLEKIFNSKNGRLKCLEIIEEKLQGAPIPDECVECCCIFGPEPGESDVGSSLLSITDVVPVAFPAPSATHGVVYITSPLLLSRAAMIAEMAELLDNEYASSSRIVEKLRKAAAENPVATTEDVASIDVAGVTVSVESRASSALQELRYELSSINLTPLVTTSTPLVLVNDDYIVQLVEQSLLRVTRVSLRADTKTVRRGALWTEEYIPTGTIFLGALVASEYTNCACAVMLAMMSNDKNKKLLEQYKKCVKNEAEGRVCDCIRNEPSSVLSRNDCAQLVSKWLGGVGKVVYIVAGGKETIGKSFIKIVLK